MLGFFLGLVVTSSVQICGHPPCRLFSSRACSPPRMSVGAGSYDTNLVVLAARKGNTESLAELLKADAEEANVAVRCDKIATMDGATPLIWAARQGKLAAVQILLSAHANVNAAASSGWTALYAAALNGHEDIVSLLVDSGADVKAAMNVGDERTNLNLNRMLLESGSLSAMPPALQQPSMQDLPYAAPAPPLPAPSVSSPPSPASLNSPADQPAAEPSDWKASARVETTIASTGTPERALAGMGELDAMKLRLEWRAPPTPEEQRGADAARQTVFKYRHDRIQELEAAMAVGGGTMFAASPAPTLEARAATTMPPAAASPPVNAQGGSGSVDAAVLARLQALEAKLEAMGGGYESGYAKGFAEGFAAGRAAD
jgi:hypothetical protein